MTTITLNNVIKHFQDDAGEVIKAVDSVSLRIAPGEVLALLGPSGCGKSTVLRLIAGLETADAGEVLYDQISIKETPMQERGIGMVFQQGALMPHWESEQTIGFFLRLRKREDEVPERVRRISQITGFGMEDLMKRRPRQLSGGERQRVAIARALARDLNVLLFDEPFSNLDAKLRSQARIELKRLLHEFPVTAVYVTHDQDEAVTLADRVAIMEAGRIVQMGNYHQLYDTPINLFVAQFFGYPPMNFFKGYIRDGHWYGESFGGYPVRRDLTDGAAVTMGIRPQYLYLRSGGVAGVVENVFPHLAERHQLVHVWLGAEKWALTLPLDATVTIGETIYCDLHAQHAHYFDSHHGGRIG